MKQTNLLPGFEPSEADLVQMALDMPYEQKVQKAILFMQTYCDGAYGAFSGGKDSCVIKELAKQAGVDVDWHYNNVTIDPPELVRFIKKRHADVKWNNPEKHLFRRMVEKASVPTRMGRWCCAEYKELGGKGKNVVVGVRLAESKRRAKIWKQVVHHDKQDKTLLAPICYWTDDDVWRFINDNHVEYCELYDEGFDRLGCVGCPLATKKHRLEEFKRWPHYLALWRRFIWETCKESKRRGLKGMSRFADADDAWSWWIEDIEEDEDQCVFEDMMEQR